MYKKDSSRKSYSNYTVYVNYKPRGGNNGGSSGESDSNTGSNTGGNGNEKRLSRTGGTRKL